jgi:hypothetical protein
LKAKDRLLPASFLKEPAGFFKKASTFPGYAKINNSTLSHSPAPGFQNNRDIPHKDVMYRENNSIGKSGKVGWYFQETLLQFTAIKHFKI